MRTTSPRLPLSRPAMTTTLSPLLILCMKSPALRCCGAWLQHFGRERHDLHEALGAQFTRHRPEDACADRLELRIEQYRCVGIKLDLGAIGTTHAMPRANNHSAVDLALLDATTRR